jgi:hypothetical protein
MKTSSRLFVLATRLALGVACWSGLGSVAQEKGTEDKSKAKGKDAPKAIVSAESKSEYKVTVLGDDDQATETELNKLGDEGWELVGTPGSVSAPGRGQGTAETTTKVRPIFKGPKK